MTADPASVPKARPTKRAILVFAAALWLLIVYLQMNSLCEGFFEFLLLIPVVALLGLFAFALVIFRQLTLRAFVLGLLAFVSTLPASIGFLVIESQFASAKLDTVAAALQRYRKEHGVYPRELSALTPRYLRRLPTTSFNLVDQWEPYYTASPTEFYVSFNYACSPSIGNQHKTLEYPAASQDR